MQVCDGHNRCHLAFHDEKHTEWEAMKDRPSKLTEDERKVERPLLDPSEGGAKFSDEFRPEAKPFAVIPQRGFQGVEFCLRPNVEPGHLPASTETLLNPFEDLLPRPGVVR